MSPRSSFVMGGFAGLAEAGTELLEAREPSATRWFCWAERQIGEMESANAREAGRANAKKAILIPLGLLLYTFLRGRELALYLNMLLNLSRMPFLPSVALCC